VENDPEKLGRPRCDELVRATDATLPACEAGMRSDARSANSRALLTWFTADFDDPDVEPAVAGVARVATTAAAVRGTSTARARRVRRVFVMEPPRRLGDATPEVAHTSRTSPNWHLG
jgi:hypothetical protein